MARTRTRRVLRWLARLVLWLIGLVAAIAVALLVVLQTDWGRERLRRLIVALANDALDGEVALDSVRIGLDGKIELDGLRFTSHGVEVLRARRVEVEWLWPPLLARRLHVTAARIDALDLIEPVAPVLKAGEAASDGSRFTFALEIDRLDVSRWSAARTDGTRAFGDVALALELTQPADGAARLHGRILSSRVNVIGETLALRAQAELDGKAIVLRALELKTDGAALAIPAATLDFETGQFAATVSLRAERELLARQLPELDRLGNITLGFGLRRSRSGAPFTADVSGHAAGAALALSAQIGADGEPIDATVHIEDLLPHRLDRRLPHGRLVGTIAVHELRPSTLEGRLEVEVAGWLEGLRLDRLQVAAVRAGNRTRAAVSLRTDQGAAEIDGRARIPSDGTNMVIDNARLRGSLPNVGPLLSRWIDVRGAASAVDLTLAGPLDALAVNGTAQLDAPWVSGIGARTVALAVDVRGLPSHPWGRFHGDAQAVGALSRVVVDATRARGDKPFDITVDITGAGTVDELHLGSRVTLGAITRVGLTEQRIRTRDVLWTGHGGSAEIDARGGVTVRDVALESPIGRVLAAGTVDPPERERRGRAARPNGGTLELRLERVDVAALQQLLAPERVAMLPLAGRMDVATRVGRHGSALAVTLHGGVKGFTWRADQVPIDFSTELQIGAGRAYGTATLFESRVGTAEIAIDATVPEELFDPAAWRALDADSVHSARLALHQIDLRHAARLAGIDELVNGTLEGTVVLPAHRGKIDEVDVELAVRGLARPDWTTAFDANLAATWSSLLGAWTSRLVLTTGGGEVARLDLGTVVTVDDLWRRGTKALLDADGRAEIVLTALPVAVLSQMGVLKLRRLAGTADATLLVEGTPRRPTGKLQASLRGLHAASARLAQIDLRAEGDGNRITASLAAVGEETRERVDANATLELATPGQPLRAVATVRALDLGFLRAFARNEASPLYSASGTLDGDLELDGPLATPNGRISATLTKGSFLLGNDIERIERAALQATLDRGAITVQRLDAQTGTGTLLAEGRIDLRTGLDLKLETRRFALLAGINQLELSTSSRIAGRHDGSGWNIAVTLGDTTIAMPRGRDQALQDLGALDGVRFVDGATSAPTRQRVENPESTIRLRIDTPDEVHFVSPEADATFVARDLVAEWADDQIALVGEIDVTGGSVTIGDRAWEVRRAHASFDGSHPIDPIIDVLVGHDFDSTTVEVGLSGNLRHRELALAASPPVYDEQQLLAIVMGGEPDDPGLSTNSLGGAAAGLGANLLLGPVKKAIRELLPIDILRVTIENSTDTGQWQLGGEIGIKLGRDLKIIGVYRGQSSVTTNLENVVEGVVEWSFLRHWLLEGRAGDQNGALDLLWTFRK